MSGVNEAVVRRAGTSGVNVGLDTDDILAQLRRWDARYGVAVTHADESGLTLSFVSLPDRVRQLAEEIARFCPDLIHQRYGCFDELFESRQSLGLPIDPDDEALADGVDFGDPSFPLILLERAITRDRGVALWWD